MSTLSLVQQHVLWIAAQHGGTYYLARRYRHGQDAEADAEYAACETLVRDHRADWLGESGPGIRIRP